MNDEIEQEQEFEAARQLRESRLQAIKEKAGAEIKKRAVSQVKKVVFRRVALWVLGIIGGLTWWIWLILLVLLVVIYFIVNPCELANIVGTWWADLFNVTCKGVQKVIEVTK